MPGAAADFMSFAEEFRDPEAPRIDPELYAEALGLQIQDLAALAGVHRTTVAEAPGNARLQGFLREALRVLSAAYEVSRDRAARFTGFVTLRFLSSVIKQPRRLSLPARARRSLNTSP